MPFQGVREKDRLKGGTHSAKKVRPLLYSRGANASAAPAMPSRDRMAATAGLRRRNGTRTNPTASGIRMGQKRFIPFCIGSSPRW